MGHGNRFHWGCWQSLYVDVSPPRLYSKSTCTIRGYTLLLGVRYIQLSLERNESRARDMRINISCICSVRDVDAIHLPFIWLFDSTQRKLDWLGHS
jgi:hypothetical protein